MFLAVIRRACRVLRDRYRHFVRVRRDLKLAVNNHKLNVREVCVGVLEVFRFNAYRIFANVRSLGRPRIGRRFLHAGCYVIQRVVSRHALVARNRMFLAVIRRACRVLRDRHNHFVRVRRDHELAIRRLRNDILSCRVNRANRTIRKVCRIFANVRSLRANRDIAEIRAFRRTGKAGNALLLSIIRHSLALRRQLDVLIIVESNLVIARPNRDLLGSIRYRRVAIGPDGGFRHLFPEHLACDGLGIRNLSGRPVPVVIHRVAQVGSRRVIEVKNVLVIANRERRFLTRYQRVARNLGGRGHSLAERRSSSYRLCNFSRCFFQIIVYRVVSNHRPHVFIIELYIFYRFVKIYLGVKIRIAFPFCF